MFVRLTYLNFLPGKVDEAKRIYNEEIVRIVRQQMGNIDCRLLEPVDPEDDYISMTVWNKKEDAIAYQASEIYKDLIERVQALYSKNPELKIYFTEKALETA